MGRLTTHVLDVSRGIPARGVRLELHDATAQPPRVVAEAVTNEDGRCPQPLLEGHALRSGHYVLTFHLAEYFRSSGATLSDPPFIDEVTIRFGIADSGRDCHIPLLVSPWAYSTYRGS